MTPRYSVLFVCMGNICRSPTAHGVFQHKVRASGLAEKHDLILAMDWDNLALLRTSCPPQYQSRLRRLTEFCSRHSSPVVPDPYYGGAQGFEHVLDLVEDACEGLLLHVNRQ